MTDAPKILLADDDEDLVAVLSDRLEANGYSTMSAYEGIRAVELAINEKPDLILLDWKMPAGKGSAVLDMLAEKDETKEIPVIILSGVDEPFMKETAERYGVFGFVRKPYDAKQLLEKIEAALK